MVGHGGSSASWYLADPTSPIPSHCASIVVTSTLRVNNHQLIPSPGGSQFLVFSCVVRPSGYRVKHIIEYIGEDCGYSSQEKHMGLLARPLAYL